MNDERFIFTLISYAVVLAILANSSVVRSSVIGLVAFIAYFWINGIFLGHAFFEQERVFFRLMFGLLLLVMLLGFVGWLAIIIYNLDVVRLTLVLLIVATISSALNKRVKNEYGTKQTRIR